VQDFALGLHIYGQAELHSSEKASFFDLIVHLVDLFSAKNVHKFAQRQAADCYSQAWPSAAAENFRYLRNGCEHGRAMHGIAIPIASAYCAAILRFWNKIIGASHASPSIPPLAPSHDLSVSGTK
jgi:hypothetical protein